MNVCMLWVCGAVAMASGAASAGTPPNDLASPPPGWAGYAAYPIDGRNGPRGPSPAGACPVVEPRANHPPGLSAAGGMLPQPAYPPGIDPGGEQGDAATTIIYGNMGYLLNSYVYGPAYGATAVAWDRDSYSADDYLGACVVDANGNWSITFDNDQDSVFEGGTADVYVVFTTTNGSLDVVTNTGGTNAFYLPLVSNIGAGYFNYGNYAADGGVANWSDSYERAYQILAELTDAWSKLYYLGQPHYTSCMWYEGSADGPYYNPNENRIHLRDTDRWAPEVLRQYAHSHMDTLYGEDYIPYNYAADHLPITAHTSPQAAMAEGYATFLSCYLLDQSTFWNYYPNGGQAYQIDIEPNWDGYGDPNGNADGLSVGANTGLDTESAVAALLWDLEDNPNDPYDHSNGRVLDVLLVLRQHRCRTMNDFYAGWAAQGLDQLVRLTGQMQVHGMDLGPTFPTIGLAQLYTVQSPWYWSGPAGVHLGLMNYGSLPFPMDGVVAKLAGPSGQDLSPQLGSQACDRILPEELRSFTITVPHLNPVADPVLGNYTVRPYYRDAAGSLLTPPLAASSVPSLLTVPVVADPDAPDFCTATLPDGATQAGDASVRVHVESKDTESDISGYITQVGLTASSHEFAAPIFWPARGVLSFDATIPCSTLPHGVPLYVSVEAVNVMGLKKAADPVSFRVVDVQKIQGTVDLQDWGPGPQGMEATFELREPGSSSALETHTVALGSGGAYSFETALSGSYNVRCRCGHWLARKADVELAGGTAQASFSLVNGDVDRDNAVTVFDYNALSDAFDSIEGDANWNADADLDGDEAITVYDYNILSASFDKTGDE